MRIVSGFFFLFLLTCFNQRAFAQVDSMMNVYHENFPQEKIQVHFDKNYYNPGETIWFKGYILSGISLSGISKNFYAELINEKGSVIQRVVSPVVGSSAAGSFTIPANFSNQFLHFRAFTTWMLNFDTSFLFEKNIRVITAATTTAAPANNVTSLQFFPEGGDMISDLETVLAFKANDNFGLPVKVKGYVKDAAGKKVIDFTTRHDGLGSLVFTPAKGETYSAVWKDSTNKEITTRLPAAKPTGMVMTAKTSTGAVTFIVKRSDGDDALKQVYLIAHMDQQLVYKARINLSQNFLSSGRIPVDQLPSGVLQLTLFNSKWQPLAERVVFVNNNDYMFDAYVRTLDKKLTRRGKNVIELEIPDTSLSNFSLSITDANINSTRETDENIYSRILLTGDLRGYVHNPGYYFASFADSVAQQLDLVMLTHGWRRFNWDDIAQGKSPAIKWAPDNYLALKGTVVGTGNSKLTNASQLNLILQFKDSSTQFVAVPIAAGGKFAAEPMVFYDTAKVFYQLNKDKVQPDRIILTVDNGLWKGYNTVQLAANVNEGESPVENTLLLNNRKVFEATVRMESDKTKKARMLQEVVVRAKIKSATSKMEDTYTSGLFKGGDGYNFDLTSDPLANASMSIFNYLQGKVPGLQISNAMSATPGLSWRGGTPDLFLNEMRTDASAISSISMADIAYIKVFRPPFMGSIGGGSGGAIAIYTKKGGVSTNNDFVGLNKVSVNGYTPIREFYSPNYAQTNALDDLDDLRTTLLWEPFIFLDKDKRKVTLSFYNNDISKKLRVVVEGVNDNGKLTHVESMIE